MFSEQIAEYFASVKFKPDTASLKKVDQFFSIAEKRIARVVQRIEKQDVMGGLFKVNNAQLARQLNKSLNAASRTTVFTVSNFKIDQGSLEKSLQLALARAKTSVTISPVVNKVPRTPTFSPQTGGRKSGSIFNDMARNSSLRGLGTMWHSVLAGGGILTGFGLRSLNTTMRELQMMPVSMESVTGSRSKAEEQLAFLDRLGSEVGATRRELVPEYTKFFASAMGTSLEPFAQSGFRSLTRYGKVMGLDKEAMKGTFKSITQMVSKQQIMAEELKGQTAERLPAAIRLMAEAVTGGDTKALFKMMEAGQLNPNTALPKFFAKLEEKAAQGWKGYEDSSAFEQNMAAKRFEDLIMLQGKSGGYNAQMEFWKSINTLLANSDATAKAFGRTLEWFSGVFKDGTEAVSVFNSALNGLNNMAPEVRDGVETIGLAMLALSTKTGRALIPLTTLFGFIHDIAAWRSGGKSLVGMALGEDYNGDTVPASYKNRFAGQRFGGQLAKYSYAYDTATGVSDKALAFGGLVGSYGLRYMTDPLANAGQGIGNMMQGLWDFKPMQLSTNAFIDNLTSGTVPSLQQGRNVQNKYEVNITHANGNGEEIWGIFKNKLIELDANNPVGE